jgi:hypothetical protein
VTRSDIIDVTVHLHHETEKAVLVSDTGDKDDAVWLPLSQIEIERDGATHSVSLPEWLAIDKGLV